ncbi:hypothetical protein PSHT_11167 [Puccinia striiformis]|uniref:Uncharacterized protein n=1 Tax=Puccinia striiformis TaxID=27350 RepID=A0A2S4V574_9BASI|nr:hypothetical protein PSHT_11167 [Puccinia striiformis]
MSSYNPPASGSQYEAHSISAALFESRSNMANQINKSPVDSSSTSISYSRRLQSINLGACS